MRASLFLASLAGLAIITARLHATSYPVKPDAGPWLILVQSYYGDGSGQLAEELCTSLRHDYKVNAFVFDHSEEARQKERERIAEERRKLREKARASGVPDDAKLPPVRTYHINDQYAVLIGGWKDQETARKALDEVRTLKPPPEKFQDKQTIAEKQPNGEFKVYQAGVNPFKKAFVVRNPTIPIPPDPEKGKLQNLKEYNDKETLSLLKCRKKYTLMVKVYQGATQVANGNVQASFAESLGGSKPGQLLSASGQQAHALAETLKLLKDARGHALISTDVFVLHTEHSSYVTVGAFDRPDDPQVKQLQKTLGGLQLGPMEQLVAQPMPMEVPKP